MDTNSEGIMIVVVVLQSVPTSDTYCIRHSSSASAFMLICRDASVRFADASSSVEALISRARLSRDASAYRAIARCSRGSARVGGKGVERVVAFGRRARGVA
jgi:hypothetical protein